MASAACTSRNPLATSQPKAPNVSGVLNGLPCDEVEKNEEDSGAKCIVSPDEENTSRYQAYAENVIIPHSVDSGLEVNETSKESVLIALNFETATLPIFRHSLDTVKGIMLICKQDLPNVTQWLDEKIVYANSVQVYTTDVIRKSCKVGSRPNTQNMSINEVAEKIALSNEIALIIVDHSLRESVVEALKISDICNTGVLLVGDDEGLQAPPNVSISHTHFSTIMTDADVLLQRCAFGVLKKVYMDMKLHFSNKKRQSERERQSLEDIYVMIRASFKRSGVPSEEWPDIPTQIFQYPTNIESAVDDVLNTPDVIGCERSRGILQIYIHSSAVSSTENNIQRKLEKHGFTGFRFMRRITQKLCSSGDSVCDGRGTLGGFVKKKNVSTVSIRDHVHVPLPIPDMAYGSSIDALVALVSKHATQGLQFLAFADIPAPIGLFAPVQSDGEIDILPVDVFDEYRHLCDTAFKTEHNARMTFTRLSKKEEIQDLIGSPVHIWGAKSRPGLGILVRHELRTHHGLRIIVRDRTCAEPFAQPGDSGAMVCYFDPHRGGMLYAIAMIVEIMRANDGSDQVYTAEIVDDVLQKLSIWNGCEYKFFGDD